MRVLIYGAGAIGGYLGALLSDCGADVTFIARGETLRALNERGVVVEWADGRSRLVPVKACQPGLSREKYDLVFVTLKSMQLADAASDIGACVAADGKIVMIQNGLPWWYFERIDSPWRGRAIPSLDPNSKLANSFDLDQVVGAVIYKPVTVLAPGRLFVPAVRADKLVIGSIDNSLDPALSQIASLVTNAGLPTEVTTDIRAAKWGKLLINLLWNPLCALTQSAPGHIASTAGGAALARAMLEEGAAVAHALGIAMDANADAELARVADNFTQQPSMLQDLRAGRALELDAILNSVIDLAAITGIEVPHLKTIAACVALLDQRVREQGFAIRAVNKQ